MDSILAMIMAGGRGQRMGELCQAKPKPALTFGGSYRVIDFSLSNCLNSQIRDIAVLTGYQRSYLGNYLKRWHTANSQETNLSVLEPQSGMYLGTADSVYQNLDLIERMKVETVIILAADHVYQMDYREMVSFHQDMKADVTVGVIPVPIERASQFGTVRTDAGGQIIEFVEKPARPQSNLVSMGIYVFNTAILRERLTEDAKQADSVHDFGYIILPRMVGRDRMYAYQFNGYWQDIGTPEAYYRANLDLVSPYAALSLDGVWPIFPADKDCRPRNIKRNLHIQNSLIGPGCEIKGYIENSILSPGVWVAEGAVVKDSVIMANVSIGRYSSVTQSIIDEGAVIGEHCNIGIETEYGETPARLTILGVNIQVPSCSSIESGKVRSSSEAAAGSGFDRLPEQAMS